MQLVNLSIRDKANIILEEIDSSLASTKEYTEAQASLLKDARAIKANLENIKTDEDYKNSVLKIASLVKQAFSICDSDTKVPETLPNQSVSPNEFRGLPHDELTKWNQPTEVRVIDKPTEYKEFWPETIADNFTKKTKSMYDPLRMAEFIVKDLSNRLYVSAQDAFDGFCNPRGPYGNASAYQKVQLAHLLQSYGFMIECGSLEKEAESDKKEFLKIHGLGDGKKPPEKPYAKAELEVQAAVTNDYCNSCGKTTQHSVDSNGNKCCTRCGTNKNIHKKASILDMFVSAGPLNITYDNSGNSVVNGLPQAQPAKSNIVNLTIDKLKQMFGAFSGQKPTAYDITSAINKTIDENIQDESERAQEKEYLINNPAVMQHINSALSANIRGACLKQALSDEAQKWISEKIEYLIKNEGKTKDQAAGQAYGMAREKFGEHVVPKKGQYGSPTPNMTTGPGVGSGNVTGLPGYQASPSQSNGLGEGNTTMEKTSEMPCKGCGYNMSMMMKDGKDKNCPKCGILVPASGSSAGNMNNDANKQPGLNQATNPPEDATQIHKQMSDGGMYQGGSLKEVNILDKFKFSTATASNHI